MSRRLVLSLLLCLAAPLGAATDRPLKSFPDAELKAKDAGADFLFVVGGDNRPTTQGAPLPRVVKTIFSEVGLIRPDFVIWTGDTVYGYCDTREELEAEYQAFRAAAHPIEGLVPLFNSPGNHEIHGGQTCSRPAEQLCGPPCSEDAFRGHFGQLWGSFDYAGAHFIALDTDVPGQEDSISGEQLEWLKRDLEANKGARAIFVFTHTEFYSSPVIDKPAGTSHPAVGNRCELQDLFRRYPVKAVFSGHEHVYWRETAEQHDGIDYFVAGGSGAPLYASPDRGGFSHYLVVRISGDKIGYEVVEPGRLYLEEAAGKPGEHRFWIVNSDDFAQPIPLRGIDVDVPASLGKCGDLEVTATSRRRDAETAVPGVTIGSCAPAAGGKLRLHIEGPPVGQGSFLVVVRKKAGS
jgi:hypothetical protein